MNKVNAARTTQSIVLIQRLVKINIAGMSLIQDLSESTNKYFATSSRKVGGRRRVLLFHPFPFLYEIRFIKSLIAPGTPAGICLKKDKPV